MDGTMVRLNTENDIIDFYLKKKRSATQIFDDYYKTVNIYKFSKEFSPQQLCAISLKPTAKPWVITNITNRYYG